MHMNQRKTIHYLWWYFRLPTFNRREDGGLSFRVWFRRCDGCRRVENLTRLYYTKDVGNDARVTSETSDRKIDKSGWRWNVLSQGFHSLWYKVSVPTLWKCLSESVVSLGDSSIYLLECFQFRRIYEKCVPSVIVMKNRLDV